MIGYRHAIPHRVRLLAAFSLRILTAGETVGGPFALRTAHRRRRLTEKPKPGISTAQGMGSPP